MPQDTHGGDALRRAMSEARLRDVDIATSLDVDPKTVQRWLQGRLPQSRHRWALADLLAVHEFDLWPQLAGATSIAPELQATYSYRAAVPREVWLQLFERARHEIGVLVYSGLFIAEDVELIRLMERKAAEGVSVRLLLGDPESRHVSERGDEEGIADAMAAKIRNAIVLYRPLLGRDGVEIRLHPTVLYNSLYRADDDLLVNQHVFGVAAAYAPVLHLRREGESEMFGTYLASFDRVWDAAAPLAVPA
jgi:phosphatidylserine/phosphatidylglycerophosphate/cardiolipin synthase-like enzyme